MLVEKSVKEALMDYAKGRKVVVLQCSEDGKIDANLLSDFLEYDNNKYLVDVPAVIDPEFESAVQDMMKGSEMIVSNEADADPEPIESKTDESDSMNDEDGEEKQLPPPSAPELKKEDVVPAKNRRKKEYDPEVLRKYVLDGKSNKEIAGLMGVNITYVKNWICECSLTGLRKCGTKQTENRSKSKKQESEVQNVETIESNVDRHKCRTCKYRDDPAASRGGCNYLTIVGHSRGCSVENCNVYEKGKKVTKKEAMRLREV